jgi:hypothetical protein
VARAKSKLRRDERPLGERARASQASWLIEVEARRKWCLVHREEKYLIWSTLFCDGRRGLFSPTHKRTEGRAPVCGSEFTTKDAHYGGDSAEVSAGLNWNSHRFASNFGRWKTYRKHEENTKPRKKCIATAAPRSLSKGGDGDAAAAVAHAVKGGDGEDKEDAGTAAALPHAVAPVGAPSAYCCGVE